jgi:hypothetical protein
MQNSNPREIVLFENIILKFLNIYNFYEHGNNRNAGTSLINVNLTGIDHINLCLKLLKEGYSVLNNQIEQNDPEVNWLYEKYDDLVIESQNKPNEIDINGNVQFKKIDLKRKRIQTDE